MNHDAPLKPGDTVQVSVHGTLHCDDGTWCVRCGCMHVPICSEDDTETLAARVRLVNDNDAAILAQFGGASELVFWAFRYFTGRRTGAACTFAEHLAAAWPLLDDRHRTMIRRELTDEFKRDDAFRRMGYEWLPLGHDCDRAAWEQVREAWRAHDGEGGE